MNHLAASLALLPRRFISTTATNQGKKNFKKFLLYNKRGPRLFKKERHLANPDMPLDKRGVRDTGFIVGQDYIEVPEKIPDLIVPDLTGCQFKPYVSYKTPEVVQTEFTSEDLFNAVYSQKILEDFKNGNLNEDGSSKQPSKQESMSPEEAHASARKTGSDIF